MSHLKAVVLFAKLFFQISTNRRLIKNKFNLPLFLTVFSFTLIIIGATLFFLLSLELFFDDSLRLRLPVCTGVIGPAFEYGNSIVEADSSESTPSELCCAKIGSAELCVRPVDLDVVDDFEDFVDDEDLVDLIDFDLDDFLFLSTWPIGSNAGDISDSAADKFGDVD